MKKIHLVLSVLTLLVVGGLAYCEWTEESHWSEGRWQSVRHQDCGFHGHLATHSMSI